MHTVSFSQDHNGIPLPRYPQADRPYNHTVSGRDLKEDAGEHGNAKDDKSDHRDRDYYIDYCITDDKSDHFKNESKAFPIVEVFRCYALQLADQLLLFSEKIHGILPPFIYDTIHLSAMASNRSVVNGEIYVLYTYSITHWAITDNIQMYQFFIWQNYGKCPALICLVTGNDNSIYLSRLLFKFSINIYDMFVMLPHICIQAPCRPV